MEAQLVNDRDQPALQFTILKSKLVNWFVAPLTKPGFLSVALIGQFLVTSMEHF